MSSSQSLLQEQFKTAILGLAFENKQTQLIHEHYRQILYHQEYVQHLGEIKLKQVQHLAIKIDFINQTNDYVYIYGKELGQKVDQYFQDTINQSIKPIKEQIHSVIDEAKDFAREAQTKLLEIMLTIKFEIESVAMLEIKYSHQSRKINVLEKDKTEMGQLQYQKNKEKHDLSKKEQEDKCKNLIERLTQIKSELTNHAKALISKGQILSFSIMEKQADAQRVCLNSLDNSEYSEVIKEYLEHLSQDDGMNNSNSVKLSNV